MDIKEKEIDLLEDNLNKIRIRKNKLDSTSGSIFLLSFFIYITSEPSSLIKLAIIGFEVKSLYAVYILYVASLLFVINYVINFVREMLLFKRYKAVLLDVYGSTPESLPLIFETDYDLRKRVFTGGWRKINAIYNLSINIPFLVGYLWMSYELITISSDLKFTNYASFIVLVLTIYFLLFSYRALYLNWRNKKSEENEVANNG